MNRDFDGARIVSGDCRRTYAKDFHIVEVWAVFTVFAYFLMAPARADFFVLTLRPEPQISAAKATNCPSSKLG